MESAKLNSFQKLQFFTMNSVVLFLILASGLRAKAIPLTETGRQEILTDAELKAKHEAMERPGLYGGDMLGRDADLNNEASGNPWTNGVVPYVIHRSLSSHRDKLLRAIGEFEQKTCLKFKVRTNERAYIQLQDGNGCNSYVGQTGMSPQPVNLQINGCLSHSTIVHELGHAIGLLHTHQRSDRDNFIRVHLENVAPEYRRAFNKENGGRKLVAYDTTSVMHYDSYAASTNGKPTITTRNGGIIRDPPGLSANDVRAIKLWYKCPN